MEKALCCSECGEVVIKSVDSSLKLRSKVIIFRDDQALAVCKKCESEIPVPIKLDNDLAKSIASNKKLRLYVKS